MRTNKNTIQFILNRNLWSKSKF